MIAIDDIRIQSIKPLISPALLMSELSVSEALTTFIARKRQAIARIIHGQDKRLLVIVGPCSIHDEVAALDYAARLKQLSDQLADQLLIVMRVYFEKPRTTIGWKGYINDPELSNNFNINKGLRMARELLLKINQIGLPCASEFLDTIIPQYLADLISWGAIGARTTESQVHRELASGLSMPIGFKNGTSGDVQIALDAVKAASFPHHFLSVTKQGLSAIVSTTGNEDAHVILRGGKMPNYDLDHLQKVAELLQKNKIATGIVVDCSHGNSQKNHQNQAKVLQDLTKTKINHPELPLCGVMLESHLCAGRQDLKAPAQLTYGQSITDACIDWAETEAELVKLAGALS